MKFVHVNRVTATHKFSRLKSAQKSLQTENVPGLSVLLQILPPAKSQRM